MSERLILDMSEEQRRDEIDRHKAIIREHNAAIDRLMVGIAFSPRFIHQAGWSSWMPVVRQRSTDYSPVAGGICPEDRVTRLQAHGAYLVCTKDFFVFELSPKGEMVRETTWRPDIIRR